MWVLQEEIIFFFTLSFLPDLLSCGHRAFEGTAFLIFIIVSQSCVCTVEGVLLVLPSVTGRFLNNSL